MLMACHLQAVFLQSALSKLENDAQEKPCFSSGTGFIHKRCNERSRKTLMAGLNCSAYHIKCFASRRNNWKISFALDTGGIPENGGQESMNSDRTGLGSTRLGRIAIAGARLVLGKLNSTRKNLPMKVFLLLLGFYTANALATILGQTGDWDVLVAGVVVAAIEGIGMLMYKKPNSSMVSSKRFQDFVVFMNYWKAGVCLGLFVDAFKLGS